MRYEVKRDPFPPQVDALLEPTGAALVQITPELADNGRGLEGVKNEIAKSNLVIVNIDLPKTDDDDDDDQGDDGTARFTLAKKPPVPPTSG